MSVSPKKDHGQELSLPQDGHVIGFVDTKPQLDEISAALKQAGYQASQIVVLSGKDGQELLERDDNKFYFGDGEDDVLDQALGEIVAGHFVLAVDVKDQAAAAQVAQIGEPLGGRRFSYFGTWINERLT